MQPTITSTTTATGPLTAAPTPRSHRRSRRSAGAVAALAIATLLASCGGGSSDGSAATGDAPATTAADSGSSSSDDATTTTAVAGSPDLDVCAEVTEEDIAAILPEADLTDVSRNEAIPAPNCRYSIDISGGGTTMTADVVSIVWNDPSYFDGQQELQSDEQPVDGLGADAFSIDDSGLILVRGASGTFAITRGVELTAGGQPASAAQMAAIAKLVQDL